MLARLAALVLLAILEAIARPVLLDTILILDSAVSALWSVLIAINVLMALTAVFVQLDILDRLVVPV